MTMKTAQKTFEDAQQIAASNGDHAMEHIAAGLAELTRSLQRELYALEQKMNAVESKVRYLR